MGIPTSLVFALSALLSQPQPQAQPPAPPADVICSLSTINVGSKAVPGSKEPPHCTVSAILRIRTPEGVVAAARNAAITEVLDDNGKDILVKRERDAMRPDETRRELCYELCNVFEYRRDDPIASACSELTAVPSSISSFSGELDAFVARNVVREKVELKVTEEPVELVPGLTFLITSVEEKDNSTKISFEVHTKRRRGKDGGEPGLEPVFAGLMGLRADGKPAQTFNNGSDFDTRDEHIMIVKDMGFSGEDVVGWQVCALDKIERVHLTFCTKRLKIAEEGR
jgi:hypothetical protein